MPARFLTRAQVAEELNIGMARCYALIRRGELMRTVFPSLADNLPTTTPA